MALGLGAGDELRAPLAITLVVIPCIYLIFSGRMAAESATVAEPQPAES